MSNFQPVLPKVCFSSPPNGQLSSHEQFIGQLSPDGPAGHETADRSTGRAPAELAADAGQEQGGQAVNELKN